MNNKIPNTDLNTIEYDKDIIVVWNGRELNRFYEFKICELDECQNQVKVGTFKRSGHDMVMTSQIFANKRFCYFGHASVAKNSSSMRLKERQLPRFKSSIGGDVQVNHIQAARENLRSNPVSLWLSPGL